MSRVYNCALPFTTNCSGVKAPHSQLKSKVQMSVLQGYVILYHMYHISADVLQICHVYLSISILDAAQNLREGG